jgi:hypothetical protein
MLSFRGMVEDNWQRRGCHRKIVAGGVAVVEIAGFAVEEDEGACWAKRRRDN